MKKRTKKAFTSIIILSKDKLFFIKPCIESLMNNLPGNSFEIIIGDTGSTSEAALAFYEEAKLKYPKNLRIEFLKYYHFSKNNNTLSRIAKGTHFLFLNNDTYARNNFLKPMLNHLLNNEIGTVGAKLLYHDDTVQHAGIEFAEVFSDQIVGFHPYQRRRSGMPEINIAKFVPAVTGACLLVSAEIFNAVGGFNEQYIEESQDTDLCLKIAKLGKKSAFEPSAQLYHFENGTRKSRENERDRKYFHDTWQTFIKSNFLLKKEQSIIIDPKKAAQRLKARKILFFRAEARGDVFATSSLVPLFKAENPHTHITFKTKFPEFIDQCPGIDRALGMNDIDTYEYDEVIRFDYESGAWRDHPITWIEEMARQANIKIPAKRVLRPTSFFTDLDRERLSPLAKHFQKNNWIAISTGAGWFEKQWTNLKWDELSDSLIGEGYNLVQIGGGGDYVLRNAEQFLNLPLAENLTILQHSRAAILLDSFPLHLAMCVQTPTIFLSCKTCRHTGYLTPEIVQLRHTDIAKTPLPTCRTLGCRLKFGNATENSCLAPILHELPTGVVIAALKNLLRKKRRTKIREQA